MIKYLELDGIKYKLIPIESEEAVLHDYNVIEHGEEEEVESVQNNLGIKRAEPKLYEYRERYKKNQLTYDDVRAKPVAMKPINPYDPSILDEGITGDVGYNPWVGDGVTIDF